MGVKVYRRTQVCRMQVICRSAEQARRWLDTAILHIAATPSLELVRPGSYVRGNTATLKYMYDVAGGWQDDADDLVRRVQALCRPPVEVQTWDLDRREQHDRPRLMDEVVRAVARSRQRPTQLEGSREVSALPYRHALCVLGFDVRHDRRLHGCV